MAKWQRQVVGDVRKNDKGGSYIKIKDDVTLKRGQCLNVESKAEQLAGVDKALADGKMSEEVAEKVKERINKIPDFILREIILLNKLEG